MAEPNKHSPDDDDLVDHVRRIAEKAERKRRTGRGPFRFKDKDDVVQPQLPEDPTPPENRWWQD